MRPAAFDDSAPFSAVPIGKLSAQQSGAARLHFASDCRSPQRGIPARPCRLNPLRASPTIAARLPEGALRRLQDSRCVEKAWSRSRTQCHWLKRVEDVLGPSLWRGARVVEWARLESGYTVYSRIEGSNPSLSARNRKPRHVRGFFISRGSTVRVPWRATSDTCMWLYLMNIK